MDRKAVMLCVLICLIVAFLLGISTYSAYLMRSPLQALPGLVALILRDGALIFFVAYLYRQG
jgi:flagellar basal body-associated protein FliL